MILRPVLREVLQSPFRSPFERGRGGFGLGQLFSAGQAGLWVEAAAPGSGTQYQDSAGTTPVAAVGDPLGKVIDKSGRGNHLAQATTTARPLLSARVNKLQKTDNLADPAWYNDGTNLAQLNVPVLPGVTYTFSFEAKRGSATGATYAVFDVSNGVFIKAATSYFADINSVDYTWVEYTFTAPVGCSYVNVYLDATSSGAGLSLRRPQLEASPSRTRYQWVNTPTDYDTAGFPFKWVFDGVDDGWATAPFAVGTLTAQMDAFVVVKRNSAAQGLLGFSITGGYFGVYAAGITTSTGYGTQSIFVNAVSVPDTRDALHAALTPGQWAVVEFRNLDLSSWTDVSIGNYANYALNGEIVAFVICPAQSDSQRAAIRKDLGKKVGLSL